MTDLSPSTDQTSPNDQTLLNRLGRVDPDDLTRLRERLGRDAAAAGDLDVAWRTVDSPVGLLLLAATERGLVRVAYAIEDHDAVLVRLAERLSPRLLHAPARLEPVARQLGEYFDATRTTFDLDLDLSLTHGFRREVVQHLRTIGYGRTESYGEVARALAHPRAVRAVGTACATNPLPVVIACHRVLRSDGSLGDYAGGPTTKAQLLTLEGAR